jgi:hypothetical protein
LALRSQFRDEAGMSFFAASNLKFDALANLDCGAQVVRYQEIKLSVQLNQI